MGRHSLVEHSHLSNGGDAPGKNMTGPANVRTLRSTQTFVRELQSSSVTLKLMCNNTSVRTGMSGARMVEPTTYSDVSKMLN
eukprot:6490692-Amphidinium_carterae.3